MYEDFYGFDEKPFSLTPDPKYLFRSEAHGSACELLHYAVRRREGFVAITGDIGTGKTTLCRALLDQLEDRTFTALVLNPFVSEADLLRQILCEFGVISREDLTRADRWVSKQGLVETLNGFLLSLLPLGARALVIIDEAQNLSRRALEQVRILSNLETDKEKLLQIVLVGQLGLDTTLRSPDLRQLNQRISIRYQLRPLTRDEVTGYVQHRLRVAGAPFAVRFEAGALDRVHRYTNGIPRLINLVCDRALLAGFSARADRIDVGMIEQAAESLDLRPARIDPLQWLRRRVTTAATGLGAALVAGAVGMGLSHLPVDPGIVGPAGGADLAPEMRVETAGPSLPASNGRRPESVLIGSFEDETRASALTAELRQHGYAAYWIPLEGERGLRVWHVLVGARP